jgi:hypothetical protein
MLKLVSALTLYDAGECRFTTTFTIKKCFMIKKRHIGAVLYGGEMWNFSMALDYGL